MAKPDQFISPGAPLTNYQRELLVILMEECCEVAQRASKALRFGLDETQPGQPFDNAQRLAHEIGDFKCMVSKLLEAGMIRITDVDVGNASKREQLAKYMQHNTSESVPAIPEKWTERISAKANQIKWCVHVIGPDDVMAMPSYEAAVEMAQRCNRDIVAHDFERLIDIICFAVVAPYDGDDHAAALDNELAKQWLAEQEGLKS
ncbi:MAG: hypothetical protein JKY47_00885 [Thalassospira sp.]|jgi:hypothetical protein|uniref:hypothetical protein n=1 Tax=unclassified Thalassospira TaxID=2648997 RepID=UPI000D7610D0|nr:MULTISPECIES: hypothetical protein [unclassified Thalassospira]MBL4839367.1 hypothetical protein [Thalassospira sp.]PXX36251.1 hypothetical protein C7967_101644 [Thalassospira sp. 11-3]QPL37456.1 hypothetical protein IT971_09285 [Thalassospira sp. B30-1]